MTDSPVSPCPGSLAVAGELQFRNLHYTLPRGAYIVIPQHTQHDGPRLLIYIQISNIYSSLKKCSLFVHLNIYSL